MDLTVCMPTIPERSELRAQALASLEAQTEDILFLEGLDTHHNGVVDTMNSLADCVTTTWMFPLGDDDLVDPDHFKILSNWCDDDADIIYTWCRIEGGGEQHPPDQFQVRLQEEFGWDHLRNVNWIPASAAIRTELWWDIGGYREPDWTPHEDWDFWVRALDADARFRCVPTVTWTYRMNPEWEHRSDFEREHER